MKLDTTITEDYKFIGFESMLIQLEYQGILTETLIYPYNNKILILQR
jgi:hypothetical protein